MIACFFYKLITANMSNQNVTPYTGAFNTDTANRVVRSSYPQNQFTDPTNQFFAHAFNATTQLAQQSNDLVKHQTEELNRNNIRHVEDWKSVVVELEKRIEKKDDTIAKLLKAVTILETEKNHVNEQLAFLVEHVKREPDVARRMNTNKVYNNNNGYKKKQFNANAPGFIPRTKEVPKQTVVLEQPGYFQTPAPTPSVQAFTFQDAAPQLTESQKVQNEADAVISAILNQ